MGRSVSESEGRTGGGRGGRTSTLARLAIAGGLFSAVERFELNAEEMGEAPVLELDDAEAAAAAAARSDAPPTTRRTVTSPLPFEVPRLRLMPPFFFCCS